MFTMKSYLIVPSLLILSGLVRADTSSTKWYGDPSLENKCSQSGYGVTFRSLIRCADACAANNTCLSFFFLRDQPENCVMHSTILHSGSQDLIDVPGSAYYIMENAQTTTTAPVTKTTATECITTTTSGVTYPAFSCPADDTVFRTVTLSDNTHMTYRVFKVSLNQTDAAASCASECGFLARVTTIAKMNMLLNLTSCSGYSSYDYYIDGSNAHSEPTWDSWITSNNETIPINSTFWSPGTPAVIDSDHCVRMDWKKGHKFNNIPCANQYYYICEK